MRGEARRWSRRGGRSPWRHRQRSETGAILDSAVDAYVAMSASGHVIEWNHRAEHLLGWRREEVLGEPLAELIIPARFRAAHLRAVARFLETGQARVLGRRLELPSLRRDGREFPAELTLWSTPTREGVRFNAFIRDVADRARLQAHLSVLQRITATSNATSDLETVVRRTLEEVSELTGWPVGHAYLVTSDDEELEPTSWWTAAAERHPSFRDRTENTPFRIGEGLPGRVVATGEPVFIPDIGADTGFPRRDAAINSGLNAGIGFPVLAGRRVVGVLEFFAAAMDPPSDDLVGLLRNIGTQIGRAFERSRAAAQLAEAAEFKSRLLSVVSHDLQAPLVAIDGFAQLLHSEWEELSDAERREYVAVVNRQVGRIQRLVSDLLTMSRLEQGRLVPRRSDVRLCDVVEETVKDHDLPEVRVDCPAELVVHVDRDHLVRMLTNYLTNAAKYGRPPFEVTAVRDGADVLLRVRDHGEGVPVEFQRDLFQRFARANSDSLGSGLGLSIVRGLARAGGGDAWYEPVEVGACFVLRLPSAA